MITLSMVGQTEDALVEPNPTTPLKSGDLDSVDSLQANYFQSRKKRRSKRKVKKRKKKRSKARRAKGKSNSGFGVSLARMTWRERHDSSGTEGGQSYDYVGESFCIGPDWATWSKSSLFRVHGCYQFGDLVRIEESGDTTVTSTATTIQGYYATMDYQWGFRNGDFYVGPGVGYLSRTFEDDGLNPSEDATWNSIVYHLRFDYVHKNFGVHFVTGHGTEQSSLRWNLGAVFRF